MEILGPKGPNRSDRVYFNKVVGRLRAAGLDSDAPADEVEISDVGLFLSYLSRLPDVRQERVDAIRGQIDSGEYDVDSKIEDIVEDILEDLGLPQARIKG
jgi:anti-sigma28 factor (negative regulator of flagellin synthesis)